MLKLERRWKSLLFIGDLVLVALSMYASLILRFAFEPHIDFIDPLDPFRVYTGASTLGIVMVMLVLYIFEMYKVELNLNRLKQTLRLLFVLSTSLILVSFISYWIPHYRIFRLGAIYHFVIMTPLMIIWRYAFFTWLFPRLPRKRVLIIGAGQSGTMLCKAFNNHQDSLYNPIGFIDDNTALHGQKVCDLDILGDSDRLLEIFAEKEISTCVVAVKEKIEDKLMRNLMQCKVLGKDIVDAPSIYKEISGKVPIMHVGDSWFIFGPSFQLVANIWTKRFQRIFDLSVSLTGLLLASPAMLLVAMLIRLTSRGPIIFKQIRVGLHEKPYMLYKFRSMVTDAEKNTGAVWAQENDPRVTGFGRFLRRSRLDELPQLWNVVKGDMSFIGPRPERPEFVADLKQKIPHYSLRFLIKPGLTGWAQVNYRYGASDEDALEKLRYELYYLQEMSIPMNLMILLRTAQTVLFHRGS